MEFLARKIAQAKWREIEGLAAGEIGAEAVTVDLRASGNELSVWRCDLSEGDLRIWNAGHVSGEIADIVLVFSSAMDWLSHLDVVLMSRDSLMSSGLRIDPSPDKAITNVDDLRDRHMDVVNLDIRRLGVVAEAIAHQVRENGEFRRFREREVLSVLRFAVATGRLRFERLAAKLREAVSA